MDFYKSTIPVINIDSATQVGNREADLLFPREAAFGHDPSQVIKEMYAPPSDMKVIPETDDDAWYDEQEAKQSSLEHIYLSGPNGTPAFVNLNQGQDGYCWFYSTGHAIMLRRLALGLPNVRLNPHSGAAIIKNGRNEGGWCGLSAKFAREVGIAEEGTGPGQWPARSRDLRHDTSECRKIMGQYKTTEEWVDLSSIYNPKMSDRQRATALIENNPSPSDFDWWGHSVCAVRWVRIERGSFGLLILNSWLNWGRYGLGVLRGAQSRPNGALSIRAVKAA